ncbi:MAG: hypothetical protein ACYCW6_23310, partial [Candidatus Xenobia bacterium]
VAARPSLQLDQVYAVLFYYHTHKTEMDRYLADWLAWGEEMRKRQAEDPRLRGLRARLVARKSRKARSKVSQTT